MLEGQSIEQMTPGSLPSPEAESPTALEVDGATAPREPMMAAEKEKEKEKENEDREERSEPEPPAAQSAGDVTQSAAGLEGSEAEAVEAEAVGPATSDTSVDETFGEMVAEATGEEAGPAMSDPAFAELLATSLDRTQPIAVGDRLRAVVQRIADDVAFLDFGGPSEAVIDARELRDPDGTLKIGVGERIDVTVAAVGDNVKVTRLIKKTRDRSVLKDAWKSGATVEGKIIGTNKGGFDVQIAGLRAFCPVSQIDRVYCSDRDAYVGQTLPFRIIEYKEGGRRVVVSRRALLDEDRNKIAAETRGKLKVGDVIEGSVVRLQPFGAFVDIGGIDGLVHVSELRHARVTHPSEAVAVGQRLSVKIIGIEKLGDPKEERISLSAKVLEGDPWGQVGDRLKVGDMVSGRILRLMNYGAFVEVLPGVEGLLHVSELPKRVRHPREAVSEGAVLDVRVLDLDPSRKRLSLSARSADDPIEEPAERGPELTVGMAIAGTVSSVKPYGVFVRITDPVSGKDGLLPAEETGLERGVDLGRTFAAGSEVKAEIIRIDEQGRIRLSMRSPEERQQSRPSRGARGEGGRGEGRGEGRGGDGRRRRDENRFSGGAGPDEAYGEKSEAKAGAQGLGIMANAFKRVLGR